MSIYKKQNSFQDFRQKINTDQIQKNLKKIIKEYLNNPVSENKDRNIIQKIFDDLYIKNKESKFNLTPNILMELYSLDEKYYIKYLVGRYKYDVYPKLFRVSEFPPCLQIEPTSICNYRCVFCYQTDLDFFSKKSGKMGSMKIENFKMLIDECEGKVDFITLASRGEPTVSKDFVNMLDYVKGKFLIFKINTNASLLNDEICHAILRNEVQTVVFSADAADEKLYSRLRVNGKLNKVLKNINNFLNIKKKYYPNSKTISRVSGVKFNNEQKINDMVKLWGNLVDQVVFVDYNPWENIYKVEKNLINSPCSDLWRRMFIWWDLECNPCDVDFKSNLSPGKVSKNNCIQKIWNSDSYNNLRRKHLEDKRFSIEPCSRCSVI